MKGKVGGQWEKKPFSPVSLTEWHSFWYGLKDLFTLHELADKIILDHLNWWRHNR